MAIVSLMDEVKVIEIRGKLGRPNELGCVWCGWSECGEYNPLAGYYQKRKNARSQYFVRMRHFITSNPQTPAQQANRSKFSLAVAAWQSKTDEEKRYWRGLKRPRGMSGYNRFLREYMRGFAE